jgi:hypothetical protein
MAAWLSAEVTMYKIIELKEDNIDNFKEYVDKDIAEFIGRAYYRGLVALNDDREVAASLVWMLRHFNDESKDTQSDIIWAKCNGKEAFDEIMEEYALCLWNEDVKVSTVSLPAKNGKELRNLFRTAGFEMEIAESDIVLVRVSELSAMPFMQKMRKKKIPESIKSLNSVTMRVFRRGINKCIGQGSYGLCEDLPDLGISYFEKDVSCVSVLEGEINGFFLFHKRPSGILAIQLLRCLDDSFKTTIPYMMCRFVAAMEAKYGPEALVELDRHNEQSLLLSEKLIPRGLGIPVYSGKRNEI